MPTIDEHRKPFEVTLWRPAGPPSQHMEQRWFVGAHGDVGGGYADKDLADIPLRWMVEKSTAAGLAFNAASLPQQLNEKGQIHNSYADFLDRFWKLNHPPYYRPINQNDPYGYETVDESVQRRLRTDPTYRPPNAGLPDPHA